MTFLHKGRGIKKVNFQFKLFIYSFFVRHLFSYFLFIRREYANNDKNSRFYPYLRRNGLKCVE
jgi:hypothetical protein